MQGDSVIPAVWYVSGVKPSENRHKGEIAKLREMVAGHMAQGPF